MSIIEQQKTAEKVIEKFKTVLISHLGESNSKLTLTTTTDNLNMDAVDVVRLFFELNRKFAIMVSDADVYACVHMPVRNILDAVIKQLIRTKQLTQAEAKIVFEQYDNVSVKSPKIEQTKKDDITPRLSKTPQQDNKSKEQMVSVPKALIDEYVATAEKMQLLAAKLKQYQK